MVHNDIKINTDGQLEYVEGSDQLYTGSSQSYYENGNPQHVGQYEDGLMEGLWVYYYENGKVYAKIPFLLGLTNGLTETFYEDGTPQLKGHSKNGVRDGIWTTYKVDGTLEREEHYIDGEIVN